MVIALDVMTILTQRQQQNHRIAEVRRDLWIPPCYSEQGQWEQDCSRSSQSDAECPKG